MIELRLPYPPTVNHYYIQRRRLKCPRCRGEVKVPPSFLSREAREFRNRVREVAWLDGVRLSGRIAVLLELHQPTRAGDIDNRIKSVVDALEHAQVFDNDRQVDDLRIYRSHKVPGGAVDVRIWEIGECL